MDQIHNKRKVDVIEARTSSLAQVHDHLLDHISDSTTMTAQKITYRQFPIRLEASIADALDRYAQATQIPKTTISRIALVKFMNELENSGARSAIEKACLTTPQKS